MNEAKLFNTLLRNTSLRSRIYAIILPHTRGATGAHRHSQANDITKEIIEAIKKWEKDGKPK